MKPGDRVPVGRTDVLVARLGLGTAPLGGWPIAVTEEQYEETVQAAWTGGIRHFDTAPFYGFGNAERRLGRALADKPRSEYTISTKVGRLLRDGPSDNPLYAGAPPLTPVFDFSYDAVAESIAASRARLGIDRFDMLLVHDPEDDHHAPKEGALRALYDLRAAGEVGAIGFAMNRSDALAEYADSCDIDLVLEAGRYTLLDHSALHDLLPTAQRRGISVVAGGVFNSGVLADPHAKVNFDYQPASAEVIARARELERVCAQFDAPLRAVAIQFPLHHPAVASVVVGALSSAEMADTIAMMEFAVPDELWRALKTAGLLPEGAPTP